MKSLSKFLEEAGAWLAAGLFIFAFIKLLIHIF